MSVATEITQITGATAGSIAAPIAGAAIASTGAMTAAAATALVGGAIGLVTVAILAFLNRKGPRQKIATTQEANEAEPLLKRNLDEYFSGPRTPESKAVALKNFDDVWAWLSGPNACGNPDMGEPGRRCISERGRNGRPQWDVCRNTPEGCPNWFELYRDPIDRDVPVQPRSVSATADELVAALTGQGMHAGSSDQNLLFAGLVLVGAAVVFA